MLHITRHKVIVFVMLATVSTSLSGCIFKEWGKAFPVSESTQRCDDWFCFSDKPKVKKSAGMQKTPINSAPLPAHTANGMPPTRQMGNMQPPRQTTMQPPRSNTMPQRQMGDPNLSGYPVGVRPPYSNTPVGTMPPFAPNAAQNKKPVDAYQLPDGYGRRVPDQQIQQPQFRNQVPLNQQAPVTQNTGGLYPYEQEPDWKKDLPPSQFEALEKSLEW